MSHKRFIVLHHSATKDSGTVSWPAIEKFHRETNGWRDVGYHGGVEQVAPLDGDLRDYAYQALVGRPDYDVAAACKEAGMNAVGIHLCFVGGFDAAPPPKRMLEVGAQRFIIPWMREHGITPDRIIGHRDAGLMEGKDWRKISAGGVREYKSCPGAQFNIDAVRSLVS